MRFGALSAYVLLGASLVAASPIRVVLTEVSSSSGAILFEHAAGNGAEVVPLPSIDFIATSTAKHPTLATVQTTNSLQGRPSCMKVWKNKGLEASNALRAMFGLEPIKPDGPMMSMHHHHHGNTEDGQGAVAIDGPKFLPPLPFIGTPVKPVFQAVHPDVLISDAEGEDDRRVGPYRQHTVGHRPMWVHHRQHFRHGSFLRRVHHALMALGPWEGRAVAFVLGCGIGVLLRMVWVMVLVTARAFRGSREEEEEAEYEVVFDEAEMFVPPPQYTVIEGSEVVPVDEKKEPVA